MLIIRMEKATPKFAAETEHTLVALLEQQIGIERAEHEIEIMSRSSDFAIVASSSDGGTCGFCLIQKVIIKELDETVLDVSYVSALFVQAKERNRGVGKALLEAALAHPPPQVIAATTSSPSFLVAMQTTTEKLGYRFFPKQGIAPPKAVLKLGQRILSMTNRSSKDMDRFLVRRGQEPSPFPVENPHKRKQSALTKPPPLSSQMCISVQESVLS